ncbi:GntR family transcriptional regulator [Pseudonocardia broussonetiae]|uniref:GntR family transcriptional regulator n=1 Tax=Pseudonocardia broussonetiae TaxID=2736640 RepID=A0A6M6JK26_9PSEU|nr:GntR family transcriptional regulator [Pseudonocardia broussonetiae]QJY47400.1 GntR family transcriptional regulator [Pseudonocardia broussonetiae]
MTAEPAAEEMADSDDRAAPGGSLTVDAIFELLRNEILHGQLPAGAVVSQVKLAKRLGVNRTQLREACACRDAK